MKPIKRLLWLAVLLLTAVIAFSMPHIAGNIGDGNIYYFSEAYYCLPAVFALVFAGMAGIILAPLVEIVKCVYYWLMGTADLSVLIPHILTVVILFGLFKLRNKILAWILSVLLIGANYVGTAFYMYFGTTLSLNELIWTLAVVGLHVGVVAATFYCICDVARNIMKPRLDGDFAGLEALAEEDETSESEEEPEQGSESEPESEPEPGLNAEPEPAATA